MGAGKAAKLPSTPSGWSRFGRDDILLSIFKFDEPDPIPQNEKGSWQGCQTPFYSVGVVTLGRDDILLSIFKLDDLLKND